MSEKKVKCFHLVNLDKRLGRGDGRKEKVGQTLRIPSGTDPEVCRYGLHGCRKVTDAIRNHRGLVLCRVEIGGDVIEGTGTNRFGRPRATSKVAGRNRKVLAMVNVKGVYSQLLQWAKAKGFTTEGRLVDRVRAVIKQWPYASEKKIRSLLRERSSFKF